MKRILLPFLITILFITSSFSSPAAFCTGSGEGTPGTAFKIWKTAISTIYNVFPIKIGGVTIATFAGLEDFTVTSLSPVCVCPNPFPRIGLKLSMWEPKAFLEVTNIPGCFPSLGFGVTLPTPRGQFGFGSSAGGDEGTHSYNFHYIKVNPLLLLELFQDFVCMSKGSSYDIGWITEVDPTWNSDRWVGILNPEAILVANPIAQMACILDAGASTLGFPLDFLFWCAGSWGSIYPFSANSNQADEPSGAFLIATRSIAKLHRQLMLWGGVGDTALCQEYPMPIMMKSQYSLLPVYPVPFPTRIPIGRTTLLWATGQETPVVNKHNWVMVLYRKRDCCAF